MAITEEARKALIGLAPMSQDLGYDYTPKLFDEVPKEYRPVFKIKKMSPRGVIKVKSQIVKEQSRAKTKGKASIEANIKNDLDFMTDNVHKHLISWSNLYNVSTGDEQHYDGSIELIETLPEVVLTDLFTEILRITGFIPRG